MTNDQSRKRVEKLFAEMGQLASESNGNGAASKFTTTAPASLLWEVEALRSRVCELEEKLKASEARKAAEGLILEAALEDGILEQARKNAEFYLDRLFGDLGFPEVIFDE